MKYLARLGKCPMHGQKNTIINLELYIALIRKIIII